MQNLNERGAAYIPIAEARGITPHSDNMFNPVAFLQQALMGGKGLPDALQQIAAQGGQYAQVVNMIKGKNAQELQTYAQNLAKEYGVNLDELTRRYTSQSARVQHYIR